MTNQEKARQLLKNWRGDRFAFGCGAFEEIGALCEPYGKKALIVGKSGSGRHIAEQVSDLLACAGIETAGDDIVEGARPNAPREDVYRIETHILHHRPDMVIAVGGGSTIDACKAANALAAVGCVSGEIDDYLGTGLVKQAILRCRRAPLPLIAVETAASSAAHLTRYSNITDPATSQKKLIVDEALTPAAALFDYDLTLTAPLQLTVDGVFDSMAHVFEAYCGAKEEKLPLLEEIALTAIALLVEYAPRLLANLQDKQAREAIGLASDLGGYAIMTGSTTGPHLNSFSLVDVCTHATACGLLNPYYAVLFGPRIERQLRKVGAIFGVQGVETLEGRALSETVAGAMMDFRRAMGAPVSFAELPAFTPAHLERCLAAAKDPQLAMKLQNMPVPMKTEDVDVYMRPVLEAAASGDMHGIKEMK